MESQKPKGKPIVEVASWFSKERKVLVEQVYDPVSQQSTFEIWEDGKIKTDETLELGNAILRPIRDRALHQSVVLLPSQSEPYGTRTQLIGEVKGYIRKYVLLPHPEDYTLLAYFMLYTYLFDKLDTAPSLRIMGDLGMGKSRLLKVLSYIAYRSIRAGGSTSSATLFRMLGKYDGGTLNLEEFDLRSKSDVDQEKMAILREGFESDTGVGRIEGGKNGEQVPVFFQTFGPKIMGGRTSFPDAALNSRLFKVEMVGFSNDDLTKAGITHDLDRDQMSREALTLRNKMLRFRQEHFFQPLQSRKPPKVENRVAQVLLPILKTVVDDESEPVFLLAAQRLSDDLIESRTGSREGVVLKALGDCWTAKDRPGTHQILNKAITAKVKENERWKSMSAKTTAEALRSLGLTLEKGKAGKYVEFEPTTHAELFDRYGLECPMYVDFAGMSPSHPSPNGREGSHETA